MQIGGIAPALTTASARSVEAGSLANQVGIAMLDNSLESAKTASDGMIKMMEMSVNPNLGGNLDLRV